MNKNLIVGIVLGLAFSLTACNNNTYSKLLKQENKLISSYISRMGIRIVSEEPTTTHGEKWEEKDYIAMPSYDHFYYHLSSTIDTTKDTIVSGDVVNVRFRKYKLDAYSDTINYWTTDDAGEPLTFTVGNMAETNACTAWHIAILQMKYSGSECKIICPSTIGFDDDNMSVTPYGYDLRVTKRR